jgi:hypothetical protein
MTMGATSSLGWLRGIGTVALISACAITQVVAAEWVFDPRVDLTASYDDNYVLATESQPKESVYAGIADLSLDINGRWPTSSLLLEPRVRTSITTGNIDQDATDGFLTLRWDSKGQKSRWAVFARYSDQVLFRQYFGNADVTTDLGAPSDSTNLRTTTTHNRQELLEAQPNIQFQLTERTNLGLFGYYTDSSYGQTTKDYVSYRAFYGLVSLGFAITPRSTLSLRGVGQEFTPDLGADSHSYGLQTEWATASSAIQHYYLRVGVDHTSFDGNGTVAVADDQNTVSGGAGINWVFQVNGLFIDATHNVYPNSTGTASANTELRFRFQHLFTPRASGYVALRGVQYDTLGNVKTADGSRYGIATIGGEWRVTKGISLVGTLNRATQKLNSQAESGTDNFIQLSFIYEPHRGAQSAAIYIPYH